eukprot:11417669-Prorocentrum_lima.AAC.1
MCPHLGLGRQGVGGVHTYFGKAGTMKRSNRWECFANSATVQGPAWPPHAVAELANHSHDFDLCMGL